MDEVGPQGGAQMQRTQTAECTEALSQHLEAEVGIRSNHAQQLARVLVERAHDTVEAFDTLTQTELRGLGFADGHIKRIETYRARQEAGTEWRDVHVAVQWAPVGPRSAPGTPPTSPPRLRIDTNLLAASPGNPLQKVIVVSCPEKGTLDLGGSGPYDELVMDKVLQLGLKLGCDRAGSSTAREEDKLKFASDDPDQIRDTLWFHDFQTSAKRAIILECQHFHGLLDVVCIEGGPVTRIEHEAISAIIKDAKADAGEYGTRCRIRCECLSYADFLYQYDEVSGAVPSMTLPRALSPLPIVEVQRLIDA
jgi:hypothetical protein